MQRPGMGTFPLKRHMFLLLPALFLLFPPLSALAQEVSLSSPETTGPAWYETTFNAVATVVKGSPEYDEYSDLNLKGAERTWPWQFFSTRWALRSNLNSKGLPGLIDIPTATITPMGAVDIEFNNMTDLDIFPTQDSGKSLSFLIGFFPRIAMGGRGCVPTNAAGKHLARDLMANIQVLPIKEGRWWPSLALGWQDFGGAAAKYESKYIVLSKSLFGHVRGTIGYGFGPDTLDGLFGGAEVAVNPYITVLGEYDGDAWNAGGRIFPLPEFVDDYGLPRPAVDLVWQEDAGFTVGASVRWVLGEAKFKAQQAARSEKRYHRPPASSYGSKYSLCSWLQEKLLEQGFENVQVMLMEEGEEKTLVVWYENRVYNRDQLDALGVVLGLMATNLPSEIARLSIIMKVVNIPVLQLTTNIDDFLDFINDKITRSAYSEKVEISNNVKPLKEFGAVLVSTPKRDRSWLKLDVFLRPDIDTILMSEIGTLNLRFGVIPDGKMQFFPGTIVSASGIIPVVQTKHWPDPDLPPPAVNQALLNQALGLPMPRFASSFCAGITQISIGQFNPTDVGVSNQTMFSLLNGYMMAGFTVAGVGMDFGSIDTLLALGNVRGRYPPWNITLSVTGGQFRYGDVGVVGDLSRFFGNTQIGLFIKYTDTGLPEVPARPGGINCQAGIRIAVPLCFSKSLKPWVIRPRLPDVFSYAQQSTIFADRNVVKFDVGRTLGANNEIEKVYWNRDRLYPEYIQSNLNTIKQATRRWVK